MEKQPKFDYSDIKFKDNGKLKLIIVVGTRPEIIRLAAVITKCRQYFDVILAHTGQNYDYNLNGIFFKDLKLAKPEVYMDAVGDDLGATCGNIINCSYDSVKLRIIHEMCQGLGIGIDTFFASPLFKEDNLEP